MPVTPHIEKHFTATATVRDIVIGMADGLTVPFALAAGLSGAVASSGLVVTAGLAEIAAGSDVWKSNRGGQKGGRARRKAGAAPPRFEQPQLTSKRFAKKIASALPAPTGRAI